MRPGNQKLITYLALKDHLDINAVNIGGYTLLSWASGNGNHVKVSLLVQAGADLNTRNWADWETPLDRTKNAACMLILLSAGAESGDREYPEVVKQEVQRWLRGFDQAKRWLR